MAILTPVTLWRDFDDSLPLDDEIISETECGNTVIREVFFSGRQTQRGRVRIYAQYIYPKDKSSVPAVMLFSEAGLAPDMRFVRNFTDRGYAVLCVDYCGDNGSDRYTYYPHDIDYANFARAGRAIQYAEPSARETSWYEWAAVARYAMRYLLERNDVISVGAVGLRTGGEILFKVAPYLPLSCMISVCAAGWLAYQDIERFSDAKRVGFDEERHRFIAGIDSQSYAPYVRCPVLLISAVNDKKYNYDRTYDTFQQINQEVDKALLFSSHGNGLVGRHSLDDIYLFLDKYCKSHSVYLSAPISFTIGENEEGELGVTCKNDPAGDLTECGYFYTEQVSGFKTRDWTRVLAKPENFGNDNVVKLPLSVYDGCNEILVYTFARYSNGFSVTSKIQAFEIKKQYKNSLPRNRVLYNAQRDELNGFSGLVEERSIADCFTAGALSDVVLKPGYGGILGLSATEAVLSYRVGESRYEAPENCAFAFDVWSEEDTDVRITFSKDEVEKTGYSATVKVSGGGKWKSVALDPDDFKSETGESLEHFRGVVSVVLHLGKSAIINNVIWL